MLYFIEFCIYLSFTLFCYEEMSEKFFFYTLPSLILNAHMRYSAIWGAICTQTCLYFRVNPIGKHLQDLGKFLSFCSFLVPGSSQELGCDQLTISVCCRMIRLPSSVDHFVLHLCSYRLLIKWLCWKNSRIIIKYI